MYQVAHIFNLSFFPPRVRQLGVGGWGGWGWWGMPLTPIGLNCDFTTRTTFLLYCFGQLNSSPVIYLHEAYKTVTSFHSYI